MVPVLILGFKRAERISELLEILISYGYAKVYVSLDGPRHGNLSDSTGVSEVAGALVKYEKKIEIVINKFDTNQGAGEAVFRGIDWFLSRVDSGIIIEDDCIPSFGFFDYCSICLDTYKEKTHVGFISGCRLAPESSLDRVFLSNIPVTWGWAVWSDRWTGFSRSLSHSGYIERIRVIYRQRLGLRCSIFYFLALILVEQGKLNAWDLQWAFFNWSNNRKSIVPPVNLITYKGLDSCATHTSRESQLDLVVSKSLPEKCDFRTVDSLGILDFKVAEFIHSCNSLAKLMRMFVSAVFPYKVFRFVRGLVR